jgi:hypothetical protein
VAARGKVVEKKAAVAGEGRRLDERGDGLKSTDAGRLRTSMLNGFVLAIMDARWAQARGGREVVIKEWTRG